MIVIKSTPVIVIIELSKDGVAIFLCVINVSFLWVFFMIVMKYTPIIVLTKISEDGVSFTFVLLDMCN